MLASMISQFERHIAVNQLEGLTLHQYVGVKESFTKGTAIANNDSNKIEKGVQNLLSLSQRRYDQ